MSHTIMVLLAIFIAVGIVLRMINPYVPWIRTLLDITIITAMVAVLTLYYLK